VKSYFSGEEISIAKKIREFAKAYDRVGSGACGDPKKS
jgi:hypothetical protein